MLIKPIKNYFCPKCNVSLKDKEFMSKIIQVCPDCKGGLINQNEISCILNNLYKYLKNDTSFKEGLRCIPDKGIKIKCPSCQKIMKQHGYMGSKYVIIDLCLDCRLIYLDRYECVVMALLYSDYTQEYERMEYIKKFKPNNSLMRAIVSYIW